MPRSSSPALAPISSGSGSSVQSGQTCFLRARILRFALQSCNRKRGALSNVVLSRDRTAERADQPLHHREELDLRQRPIHPADGDAVVARKRRGVMNRVMLRRQNQVQPLQPANPKRRGGKVGPFVELVGREYPEDQRAQKS